MDIVVSPSASVPIYQQLFDQLSAQILRGALAGGFCLPPIRTVARELEISVITVKKAWELLENAGLISTMAGKGCFVAALSQRQLDDLRGKLAREKLSGEIEYYKTLGLDTGELVDMIKSMSDDT